jgi:hypothetical protein
MNTSVTRGLPPLQPGKDFKVVGLKTSLETDLAASKTHRHIGLHLSSPFTGKPMDLAKMRSLGMTSTAVVSRRPDWTN